MVLRYPYSIYPTAMGLLDEVVVCSVGTTILGTLFGVELCTPPHHHIMIHPLFDMVVRHPSPCPPNNAESPGLFDRYTSHTLHPPCGNGSLLVIMYPPPHFPSLQWLVPFLIWCSVTPPPPSFNDTSRVWCGAQVWPPIYPLRMRQ